jgi:benzoate/toluate 1,2-dioxygenase beta subunit
MTLNLHLEATRLVALEARLLDEKRWDDWLGLFTEDATLWMPTWRNESTLTSDPDTELSFIYLNGKSALRERTSRITSGLSVSSMPQPRTCHLVTGSTVDPEGDTLVVRSNWTNHVFDPKDKSHTSSFGLYTHTLVKTPEGYRIRQKYIVLMNDYISSKLDIQYV